MRDPSKALDLLRVAAAKQSPETFEIFRELDLHLSKGYRPPEQWSAALLGGSDELARVSRERDSLQEELDGVQDHQLEQHLFGE